MRDLQKSEHAGGDEDHADFNAAVVLQYSLTPELQEQLWQAYIVRLQSRGGLSTVLSQIPYGRAELSVAPMSAADYVAHLDETFAERASALTPLYERLVAGKLSNADLQVWVKDMYQYWDETLYFTMGAAFVKTNYEPPRTHMLRKLVDIEGKEVVPISTAGTRPHTRSCGCAWAMRWARRARTWMATSRGRRRRWASGRARQIDSSRRPARCARA